MPLNFDHPLNEIWPGYLNQHYKLSRECSDCNGSGYAPDAKKINDQWYGNAPFDPIAYGAEPISVTSQALWEVAKRAYPGNEAKIAAQALYLWERFSHQWCHHLIQEDVDALVAGGRLMDFTHRPVNKEQQAELKASGGYWLKEPNGYTPTAQEVNLWSLQGLGHDSINHWICVEARCKREGVEMLCPTCKGEMRVWNTPEDEQRYREWEPSEPPTGKGYQLWENTTEGSPISPVFKTLWDLCYWCEDNADTFAGSSATAQEWHDMLEKDFVHHTMVLADGSKKTFI